MLNVPLSQPPLPDDLTLTGFNKEICFFHLLATTECYCALKFNQHLK